MKENFVRLWGMDPNKVLVTWHPYYQTLPKRELRFWLENILVLNKSNSWTWWIYREDSIAWDIWASIYYLYSIENTLKKHGVKSVRLRIHPDEDMNRYKKHINTDFFIFDKEPLSESLNKSTLVIGPWSTVFLESIYHGVNYLFYEPWENNIDCMNFPLTPPFDWSDSKAPVARNEEMLFKMIEQKKMLDKSIFNDYIKTPFDIGFLKWLIK
jgi:hypothetical protein